MPSEHYEVWHGPDHSTLRKSTENEKREGQALKEKVDKKKAEVALKQQELEVLEAELAALIKQCDHHLIRDEPGWMYSFRYCAVCGEGLGML